MERTSYCKENNCPWLDKARDVCASPNDIHGNKCDFDNGILPGYDDEGIKLKLVTWEGDLIQFLVEADTNLEAIRKAVEANLWLGDCDEEIEENIHDLTTYKVEDVDFNLLREIFQRTDYIGTYCEALVFND